LGFDTGALCGGCTGEDFDFEEALRDIHIELQDLNQEAVELAAAIA
jgi:hypothetical protein